METKQKSGVFRKRRISFAQVSSIALLDNNLSAKAKGLYSLIQYFINIPDFILYKNTLRKHMAEGDKAFDSMWKELKDKGYLIQYRLQGEKGYYYYEYELLDEPNLELANEIHSSQNRKKSEEKYHNPKKGGMDKKEEKLPKIHNPKKEGMDNRYDGQVGVYNNNNLNNNNLNNINTSSTTNELSIDTEKIDYSELQTLFENNITKLKKTTLPKFFKIVDSKGETFIKALIKFCSNHNTNSFAGFENYNNQYKDIEALKNKIESINYAKKNNNKKENSNDKITLFKEKNYDYAALERELLGWDD